MVKLLCVIVGVVEGVFFADIDGNELVLELKELIKQKKAAKTKDVDDPNDLQLFLAKTEGGKWLSSKDPDVDSLLSGCVPERVKKTYLNKQLTADDEIGDVFTDAPPSRTIHVLMKIPKPEWKATVETSSSPM